jgi:hypothetical protein
LKRAKVVLQDRKIIDTVLVASSDDEEKKLQAKEKEEMDRISKLEDDAMSSLFFYMNDPNKFVPDSLSVFNANLTSITERISKESKENNLLMLYGGLLETIIHHPLDSFQFSNYRFIVRQIIRRVAEEYENKQILASFVDKFNDIHLQIIEKFNEFMEQSTSTTYNEKPWTHYVSQLLLLTKVAYREVSLFTEVQMSNVLTHEIDHTALHWLNPIYVRMKRKFVHLDLNPSALSERMRETQILFMEEFFDRLPMHFVSNYDLDPTLSHRFQEYPKTSEEKYPPWRFAEFVIAMLQYSMDPNDSLEEAKTFYTLKFRQHLILTLQDVNSDLISLSSEARELKLSRTNQRKFNQILNFGNEVQEMMFIEWHLKYNLVGDYNATSKIYSREYLQPFSLANKMEFYRSIPRNISSFMRNIVDHPGRHKEMAEKGIDHHLDMYSVLALAMKMYVEKEYDAVVWQEPFNPLLLMSNKPVESSSFGEYSSATTSTRSSTQLQNGGVPTYFDKQFCILMTRLFYYYLHTIPSIDNKYFYEFLIALVPYQALLPVREPSKMILVAYQAAITLTLQSFYDNYFSKEKMEDLSESVGYLLDKEEEEERGKSSVTEGETEESGEGLQMEEENNKKEAHDGNEEEEEKEEADDDDSGDLFYEKMLQLAHTGNLTKEEQSSSNKEIITNSNDEEEDEEAKQKEQKKKTIASYHQNITHLTNEFHAKIIDLENCIHYFLDATTQINNDFHPSKIIAWNNFLSEMLTMYPVKYYNNPNQQEDNIGQPVDGNKGLIKFLYEVSDLFLPLLYPEHDNKEIRENKDYVGYEMGRNIILSFGMARLSQLSSKILSDLDLFKSFERKSLEWKEIGQMYFDQMMEMGMEVFPASNPDQVMGGIYSHIMKHLVEILREKVQTNYDIRMKGTYPITAPQSNYGENLFDFFNLLDHPFLYVFLQNWEETMQRHSRKGKKQTFSEESLEMQRERELEEEEMKENNILKDPFFMQLLSVFVKENTKEVNTELIQVCDSLRAKYSLQKKKLQQKRSSSSSSSFLSATSDELLEELTQPRMVQGWGSSSSGGGSSSGNGAFTTAKNSLLSQDPEKFERFMNKIKSIHLHLLKEISMK